MELKEIKILRYHQKIFNEHGISISIPKLGKALLFELSNPRNAVTRIKHAFRSNRKRVSVNFEDTISENKQ